MKGTNSSESVNTLDGAYSQKGKRLVTFEENNHDREAERHDSTNVSEKVLEDGRAGVLRNGNRKDESRRSWRVQNGKHVAANSKSRHSFSDYSVRSSVSVDSDSRMTSGSGHSDENSSYSSNCERNKGTRQRDEKRFDGENHSSGSAKNAKKMKKRKRDRSSSLLSINQSVRKLVSGSRNGSSCIHYLVLGIFSMVISAALVLGGAYVYEKVFKTKAQSTSATTSMFPSTAPSTHFSYSQQPSATPTIRSTCIDNQTFTFVLFNGNVQPCTWFNHHTNSEQRKERYCVNATINTNCCNSCKGMSFNISTPSSSPTKTPSLAHDGSARPSIYIFSKIPTSNATLTPSEVPPSLTPTDLNTCVDNQTYTLTLLNGNVQPCSWFNHNTNSEERKIRYCVNATINENCCKSCAGVGFDEMSPSSSPTNVTSGFNE